ncbi:MAG: fructosamine kinase family protein [Gammaproteobacteria bacterium]|nr:fructosamine kinase family protein [Gammaproteobacteria bacterium]MDH3766879.1 fructosamine kinase family protein [Gammaproteobacteria bacterium]
MIGRNVWDGVVSAAADHGVSVTADTARPLRGGSINAAWRVNSNAGTLFVKFNDAGRHDMFVAEAAGLAELAQANAVRVPDVICTGAVAKKSFLLLEFIELQAGRNTAARRLGSALASLHACQAKEFGWNRDNTIGTTTQINTPDKDWVSFFWRRRLAYQLDLARSAGARRLADLGVRLNERMPLFFSGVTVTPALLHGDLWGGNWASCDDQPVIFDPAVYYGDPESDIAMTSLFGGFPPAFYDAYRAQRPDQPGGEQRRELYRLYHVLNHFNLFGGGYAAQAERMIKALLKE